MPTYYYKAKKKNAETVDGEVVALNKDEAVEKISQLGLMPISLQDNIKKPGNIQSIRWGKVSLKSIYFFSRQLAGLLKAGIPLVRALQIIQDQISNRYLRQVIANVCLKIKNGKTFSDSLKEYPNIFSSLYTAMVHAGEESGRLREMLTSLSQYYRTQDELFSRIRTAIAYPVIMLILGVATIIFMMTYVLPSITGLLLSIQGSLPIPTRMMLVASEFLRVGWMSLFAIFATALFLVKKWLHTPTGHKIYSRILISVPFLRTLVVRIEVARFCRTLELLLKSGIVILRALRLSIPLINNDLIRDELSRCQEDLVAGNSFGISLKQSRIIPKMLGDLIAVGEESGTLSEALNDVADAYEQETKEALKILTTLLEPLMIILVGAAIGFIVFAVLLPVFQMDILV